jgi:hypothetical protein
MYIPDSWIQSDGPAGNRLESSKKHLLQLLVEKVLNKGRGTFET